MTYRNCMLGVLAGCLAGPVLSASAQDWASERPLVPFVSAAIYDYWVTNPGGASINMDLPADFFGSGSDPLAVSVCLEGAHFGPDAGPGLAEDADTSINRQGNPDVSQIGDVDTVGIKVHGLSFGSVAPITVTYNGGQSPEQFDVHIGLSDAASQTWGSLTATMTHSNGGLFDSYLPVIWMATFTQVGSGGGVYVLDSGDPMWGLPPAEMESSGTPWVQDRPGYDGEFHPGIDQNGDPTPNSYEQYMSENCAFHEAWLLSLQGIIGAEDIAEQPAGSPAG